LLLLLKGHFLDGEVGFIDGGSEDKQLIGLLKVRGIVRLFLVGGELTV